MLENTDKAIGELLEKLPNIIQSATDQLPDIAQQLLIYGAFDAWKFIIIGLVFLLISILAMWSVFKEGKDLVGDPDLIISLVIIALFMLIAFVISLSSGASNLYKINHAPKLYLMEKAIDYTGLHK